MDRLNPESPYSFNKALCWPDRLEQLRSGGHPAPVNLYLVPTNRCNMRCPRCLYREQTHAQKWRQLSDLSGVIRDCAAMGVKAVTFSGGGEPTTHSGLAAAMRLAQTLGIKTALITNGLRLNDATIEAAVRGSWFRLSLDAASAETFAVVRPTRGEVAAFARVLRNLKKVLRACSAPGGSCTVGINFIIQRENWREVYRAAELASALGADSIRFGGAFEPPEYFAGWGDEAAAEERRAEADFDRPGFRVFGRFRETMAGAHRVRPTHPVCHYQHLAPILGADGGIYRCCATIYSKLGLLGYIDLGLRDAWESPETQRRLREFDARACTECRFDPQNRAIRAALDGPSAAPPTIAHPEFL